MEANNSLDYNTRGDRKMKNTMKEKTKELVLDTKKMEELAIRAKTVGTYIEFLNSNGYCEEIDVVKLEVLQEQLNEISTDMMHIESQVRLHKLQYSLKSYIVEIVEELELENILPYIFINKRLSSFLERCSSIKFYQYHMSNFFSYLEERLDEVSKYLTKNEKGNKILEYIEEAIKKRNALEIEYLKSPTVNPYAHYKNEAIYYPKLNNHFIALGLEWEHIERDFHTKYLDKGYTGDRSVRVNGRIIYGDLLKIFLRLVNELEPSLETIEIKRKLNYVYDSHMAYSKANMCRNPFNFTMLNNFKELELELEKLFKILI